MAGGPSDKYISCSCASWWISCLPGGAQPFIQLLQLMHVCVLRSVAAFYLAKAGAKVVVLDKEEFPRDKYCGDAVCTPAIRWASD